MKRRPRMLWLVTSPAGSPSERAAGAALRAAAADGWEVTAVLPWRSQGAGAAAAGPPPGFASPGAVVEQRSVELAFEHFAFRGELRRDEVEPGVERWWAVPRSPRLEPPLAAAFVAAAARVLPALSRVNGLPPLPEEDKVRFSALTPRGVLTTEVGREALGDTQPDALSALYYSGQRVVSEMREVKTAR